MRWIPIFAIVMFAACAEKAPPPEPETGGGPVPNAVSPAADIAALALAAEVAELRSYPVQLRGTLRVTNPTDRTIRFDVGGCPVFLRVYDAAGEPAWIRATARSVR